MKPLLTVGELLTWCSSAPAGTQLDAASVAEILSAETPSTFGTRVPEVSTDPTQWREKLWTVDASTRLGVVEVAESLGRPASYVYAHTKGSSPIPHAKLDGALVFVAGELRQWIADREDIIAPGPSGTRTLRVLKR